MTPLRKFLLILFIIPLILCLLMVVVYEWEWLDPGMWLGSKVGEYYAAGAMEIVTICAIPVALRLLKFDFARRQLASNPERGLRRWAGFRLLMIALPMVVNTFLYYQYMNVAFGYMGIIGLLCMLFVYPSEARCQQEMNVKP